jgi:stage V sporulation protein SpoVS
MYAIGAAQINLLLKCVCLRRGGVAPGRRHRLTLPKVHSPPAIPDRYG